MRISMLMVSLAIILGACQNPPPLVPEVEKQYYSESADIDLCKKIIDAYLKGDWDDYAELYTEDARIWRNKSWITDEGMTVPQLIEDLQLGLFNIASYRFNSQTWANVINDEGEHWVFFWGVWAGQNSATETEYIIPVQISMQIVNNKVSLQADFFNNAKIVVDQISL